MNRAIVFILGLGFASTSLAWTTPERIDRRPENYVVYLCDVAVDDGGGVHVVWSECPTGTHYEMVKYSRKSGDTWTIPINISRDSGDIRHPTITADNSGAMIVVWSEEGAACLRYVRQTGDTWSLPRACFTNNGITPRLVRDGSRMVQLLFEELTSWGGIWHSTYLPGADSWASPTCVATDTWALGWSDITTGRDGRLHAVWMSWSTYGLFYSSHDGQSWSVPTALPDPAPRGQSCDPRIACDGLGHPHVVWEERSGGYWIYHSMYAEDSWTTPYLVHDERGARPTACADASGRIHLFWTWDYGLMQRSRTESGWNEPVLVTGSGAAKLPEAAVATDRLHLVWRDGWSVYYSSEAAPGGVTDDASAVPHERLTTTIEHGSLHVRFWLSCAGEARLQLRDCTGRRTLSRRLGIMRQGAHSQSFLLDSTPAGVYICEVTIGQKRLASKVVVCR